MRSTLYSEINRLLKAKATQSCPTLCDLMDYIVHGILQARILEWLAFPFSIFPTQGSNSGLAHCRWILYLLSHKGSPNKVIALTVFIKYNYITPNF